MTAELELRQKLMPLFGRFADTEIRKKRPFLAHYTSVKTMTDIVLNEQVWFSNPLFMNDLEEMRFGVKEGERLVYSSKEIEDAAGTSERAHRITNIYAGYIKALDEADALNTYVFCLSEHDKSDDNGLLSMWRGYGGNGSGAALVFDTSKLTFIENSPLLVVPVTYASRSKRISDLQQIIRDWSIVVKTANIPDELLYVAVHSLFSLIKFFALMNKHDGFSEEKEWRVFYLPEFDPMGLLKDCISVEFGPRGIEPRLKYKVLPREGVSAPDLSFMRMLDRIILGPNAASPLVMQSVKMLFDRAGKSDAAKKLVASNIPLRAAAR